jgi:hypothetical protein
MAEKQSLTTLNTLQPNVDSSQTLLTDVTTTSRVARWRLWAWCVAACAYALEVLFDLMKIDILIIIGNSRYGTLPWWVATCKYFQLGDTLVFINNAWQYAVIDSTKQIVAMAAAEEGNDAVILKVAKLSGSVIVKLDVATELPPFVSYVNDQKLKPAGVNVTVRSVDPDDLQLWANIKIDPLQLLTTGESISAPGTFPVQDAINTFISNQNTGNFNGVFELFELTQFIKNTVGSAVKEIYITYAAARNGTNSFTGFSERYLAYAGYMKIDTGTPLSSSLTYSS